MTRVLTRSDSIRDLASIQRSLGGESAMVHADAENLAAMRELGRVESRTDAHGTVHYLTDRKSVV